MGGDVGEGIFDHKFFVGVVALEDCRHTGEVVELGGHRPGHIVLIVNVKIRPVYRGPAKSRHQCFETLLDGGRIAAGDDVNGRDGFVALGLHTLPVEGGQTVVQKFRNGFDEDQMPRAGSGY